MYSGTMTEEASKQASKVNPDRMTEPQAARWLEARRLSFDHWPEYFDLNGRDQSNKYYRLKGEYRENK